MFARPSSSLNRGWVGAKSKRIGSVRLFTPSPTDQWPSSPGDSFLDKSNTSPESDGSLKRHQRQGPQNKKLKFVRAGAEFATPQDKENVITNSEKNRIQMTPLSVSPIFFIETPVKKVPRSRRVEQPPSCKEIQNEKYRDEIEQRKPAQDPTHAILQPSPRQKVAALHPKREDNANEISALKYRVEVHVAPLAAFSASTHAQQFLHVLSCCCPFLFRRSRKKRADTKWSWQGRMEKRRFCARI